MDEFDKAADFSEHERQQRLAALTPQQRGHFDRLLKDQERRKAEFQKRQTDSRESRIEEDKRRRLLRTQNLALRMKPEKPAKHHDALRMAKKSIIYEEARQLENLDRQFIKEQQDFLENPSQTKLGKDFEKARARDISREEDLSKRDLTKSLNRASLHRRREQGRDTSQER